MPGVFTTVVGFGQVSALSTRLAAALLREKTVGICRGHPPGRRQAFGIDDVQAKKFICRVPARAKLMTKGHRSGQVATVQWWCSAGVSSVGGSARAVFCSIAFAFVRRLRHYRRISDAGQQRWRLTCAPGDQQHHLPAQRRSGQYRARRPTRLRPRRHDSQRVAIASRRARARPGDRNSESYRRGNIGSI